MLSNNQKRYLSQLATRAFRLECAKARGRGEAVEMTSKAGEQWRHDQVSQACGKLGLRCCGQIDYKSVEAHFLSLLGETGRAFNAHIQAQSEPRRQAEAVLVRELGRFNIDIAYAAAICRRQFKCALDDASEKQIWNLVYTIRNRGNARKRKNF